MSAKERITVTIDADVAAQIKELAGPHSTSSVVERALRQMLTRQRDARARLAGMLAVRERSDPESFALSRAHVRQRLGLPESDT